MKQRGAIAKRLDEMRGTLLEKGAGSLLNKLTSEDAQVEMMRQLENSHNSVIEGQHQLDSLRADREAFVQSWSTQISQDLLTARNSRDTAAAQLDKAHKHRELVQIVAPEDAVVLTVTKLSVGSILKIGRSIDHLDAACGPSGGRSQYPAARCRLHPGGRQDHAQGGCVQLHQYGVAEGTVKWISEGAFVHNDDTGQPSDPYYRLRVGIDEVDFVNVPDNFRLIPGMTLIGEIKVGRRTLASYVWEMLSRGAGEAMREP